jgi:hypothetical protein
MLPGEPRAAVATAEPAAGADRTPAWLQFLQSSGGTALITVVLGGIVGSFITGMVQSAAHEREFDLAWLKARGDQALGAYRDYLDKEQGLVSQAYGLVGEVAASAETLINLASEGMDWQRVRSEDQSLVMEQRRAVRKAYNDAETRWRRQREALGLLMVFYHQGSPAVSRAWREMDHALSGYLACAETFHEAHQVLKVEFLTRTTIDASCKEARAGLDARLDALGVALHEGRRYAWEGWESPTRMRQALEGQDAGPGK